MMPKTTAFPEFDAIFSLSLSLFKREKRKRQQNNMFANAPESCVYTKRELAGNVFKSSLKVSTFQKFVVLLYFFSLCLKRHK